MRPAVSDTVPAAAGARPRVVVSDAVLVAVAGRVSSVPVATAAEVSVVPAAAVVAVDTVPAVAVVLADGVAREAVSCNVHFVVSVPTSVCCRLITTTERFKFRSVVNLVG